MKNDRANLERRRFLRAVGASALTYPFVRGLPSYAAAATELPRYPILLFSPTGFVRHLWGAPGAKPGAGDAHRHADSAGDVPAVLHTARTVAREGDRPRRTREPGGDGSGAARCDATRDRVSLAVDGRGDRRSARQRANGADQVIARQLKSKRPFETLELMARSTDDWSAREVKTRMIYSGPGAFKDPYDNPIAARAALFPTTPTTMTGLDRKTEIRQKLIGGSMGQLNRELRHLAAAAAVHRRRGATGRLCNHRWNELDQPAGGGWRPPRSASASPGPPPASYVSPSSDFPTSVQACRWTSSSSLSACDLARGWPAWPLFDSHEPESRTPGPAPAKSPGAS